jgi:opacity protein-like surface antigen
MKKSIALWGAVSLFALAAAAQDVPRAEVFTGFTYTRVNSASNVPAFSANGGGGQFVMNLGKWFGAVADIGAVHNGNIGGYHLDTTLTNFLFGPRIPIRVSNRITPYFQTLFGGVYGSTSVGVTVPPGTVVLPPTVTPANSTAATNAANAIALRASAQQTAFAMTVGGGLDIKINKVVSFRPIGLDYYMMRLQNLRTASDNNQHCLRYTTGFNFKFGAQ